MSDQAAGSGVEGAIAGMALGGGGMINEHRFEETVLDMRVCFQVIEMKDSCIVWVGSAQGSFSNLDVAMKTHMDDVPVCSTLIGEGGDGIGASLSKRLALKLGRQVYVSYNLPGNQQLLQAAVEKKMVGELSRIMPKAAASR